MYVRGDFATIDERSPKHQQLAALSQNTYRCAMTSVVRRFLACRLSSASCTLRSFSLSSAAVASSSSRILGSAMQARAMASRCFWPPERLMEPSSTL